MLVEAGVVALSNAFFGFADEIPEDIQHGSLANLPKTFPDIFTAFLRLLFLGSTRGHLSVSFLCCLSHTAPARPRVVVQGETTDTSNHGHKSSLEDWDAACGLGYRWRWR